GRHMLTVAACPDAPGGPPSGRRALAVVSCLLQQPGLRDPQVAEAGPRAGRAAGDVRSAEVLGRAEAVHLRQTELLGCTLVELGRLLKLRPAIDLLHAMVFGVLSSDPGIVREALRRADASARCRGGAGSPVASD